MRGHKREILQLAVAAFELGVRIGEFKGALLYAHFQLVVSFF
jgi:hypothetical protein